MSTVFEDIVPSLNLCKQIPADEFDDTVFVWVPELPYDPTFNGPKTVLPRCIAVKDQIIAPAPTVQEIFENLAYNLHEVTHMRCNPYLKAEVSCFDDNLDKVTEQGDTLADAALRLWLRLQGFKENKKEVD